jgi:ABC-2 type transport system permease protein
MRRTLRAEWVKATSDRGTVWLLAALVALSVPVSVLTVAASRCQGAGCAGLDPARISLTGVFPGQALAVLAGVLVIGGEYGTGMIRVTLAAIPRRERLLTAKAVVAAGLVLPAAVISVGAAMLAGRLILPGHGFTPASGFDLDGAAMWRACLCAVLYLVLSALLGLGVAAAIRDPAAAIGVALGIVYLFPVIAGLVTDPAVRRHLEQIGPLPAGLDSLTTAGLRGLPLTPWQGLGVVAIWAAGALLLGGAVLRLHDA